MKRAESLVRGARLLQRHVVLNDDDDIGVMLQVVDELLREQRHVSASCLVLHAWSFLGVGAWVCLGEAPHQLHPGPKHQARSAAIVSLSAPPP